MNRMVSEKATANIRKQRVSFEEAATARFDYLAASAKKKANISVIPFLPV